VADRREAAEMVARSYPAEARAGALRELGDAATAADAKALFVARCDRGCLAELQRSIGAVASVAPHGDEIRVRTIRGTIVPMYRGDDGWYGLVWRTAALDAERDHANRDLEMVRQNAAVYETRRTLEEGGGGGGEGEPGGSGG
jgi:hypothetical protein